MKRILSILLSVTIIATMLVSMSVTSFAGDKTVTGAPDAEIKFNITIEKADAGTNNEQGLENGYIITQTLSDYGVINGWKASGKQSGTKFGAWSVCMEFDEETAPVQAWSDGFTAGTLMENTNESVVGYIGYFQTVYAAQAAQAYPTAPSTALVEESAPIEATVYLDMPTDTFKIVLGTGERATQWAFLDVEKNTQTAIRWAGLADSKIDSDGNSDVDVVFEHPTAFYVKDGVQVTEEEYYGSSEPTEYTVTFKNGDSVLQSATVVEGAAVTAPEAPTAPVDADPAYNYTFVGWSDGSDTYKSDAIPAATDNVEYTAVFNSVKKTVTATFVVEGKANVTETVEYGETPTAAGVNTTVEGKTFTGWSPALGSITDDTTYTAQFTINKYTITFVIDGVETTEEYEYGATIARPDPTKPGFNFTGWSPAFVTVKENARYEAQFSEILPTKYEITFVVDDVETKVQTIEGQTPVFPGTPEKAGHTFDGWTPALAPATKDATYTAVFTPIPVEPVDSEVTITTVKRITGDIFPESGEAQVTVESFGEKHTVSAARLHRVHTTFNYEAGDNPLVEMGMLFVPKAVADAAGVSTAEEIVAADIAKDANCSNLPGEITGGTTDVVFKAGLVDVPEAFKGITIYAIPYYTLSGGTRQYYGVIETTF